MIEGEPLVAACVTLFHPSEGTSALMKALRADYDALIVIDNGNGSEVIANGDIVAIKPKGNVGVSNALNLGFAEALARGYPWVAYFDQDSDPDYGAADLKRTLRSVEPKIAMVTAQYIDRKTGVLGYRGGRLNGFPLEPISAGSAFRISTWSAIGGFDSRLPIDLVDTEFALRLQAAGYRVEINSDLQLRHSVGDKTPYRILGRTLAVRNHVSWRLYTKLDATALVTRKYLLRFPRWTVKHLTTRMLEVGMDLTLGRNRRETGTMLFKWMSRRTPETLQQIHRNSKGLL